MISLNGNEYQFKIKFAVIALITSLAKNESFKANFKLAHLYEFKNNSQYMT